MSGNENRGLDLFTQQTMAAKGGDAAHAEPEDLGGVIDAAAEKSGDWISKATGVNVASIFNVGMFANFDFSKAGIRANNPISMIKGAQGGFLAKLAEQLLNTKNLTAGIGPASQGEGSYGDSGGGGGGNYGDSGGGGDYGGGSGAGYSDFSSIAAPSHQYDFMPVSMASLGTFSPPDTPRGSFSVGEGMSMG